MLAAWQSITHPSASIGCPQGCCVFLTDPPLPLTRTPLSPFDKSKWAFCPMNLESVSQKNLNELERLAREMQLLLRKSKLNNEPLAKLLSEFEAELSQLRRERFDAANPKYHSY
jgi:hypothetical protein